MREMAFLVMGISALFVYWDASKNKIGKIKGEGGLFNMSAGGWATATFLIWIIAFPLYLTKRSSLLGKAKELPVEPSLRFIKLIMFSFLTFMPILATMKKMSGPDSLEVLVVKEGSFSNCPDKTVGEGLSKLFRKPQWESGESDDGRKFVNVTGDITFMKKNVSAKMQFLLTDNNTSFEINALEFNGVPQNKLIMSGLIAKVCE